MAFEPLVYSKSWEKPEDFPTYEPDEKQVRADLQLLHDEARDGINRLVSALNDPSAAAQLPFAPVGTLTAQTVQQAIEQVYGAVQSAASALIVDGSVTKDKLSQELLERIYGGKLWVSMNAPTAAHNPDTDFALGQLWLKVPARLKNLAREDWEVTGGSVLAEDDGWTFTADGSQDFLTASQLLDTVGKPGAAVIVNIVPGACGENLQELLLYLNGVEQELEIESGSCFEAALDQTGSLEIQLRGQWTPSETEEGQAAQTIELRCVSVVDPEGTTPENCEPCSDWIPVVEQLGQFDEMELPMEVYVQTGVGIWQIISSPVTPVSRGGTGISQVPAGALLYGTGAEALAALTPADGVLQWTDGKPGWTPPGELAQKNGYLRTATGSYEGVGGNDDKIIELPVKPLILHIWADDEGTDTATVANGGRSSKNYMIFINNYQNYYQAYVALKDSTLTISHKRGANEEDRASEYMNEKGITYHWLAIY